MEPFQQSKYKKAFKDIKNGFSEIKVLENFFYLKHLSLEDQVDIDSTEETPAGDVQTDIQADVESPKSEEEKVMAQEEVGQSKQIVIQLQSDVEKLTKSSSDLINIVDKLLNSPASSSTHKPKEKVLSPSIGSTIEEFRKKYMN